MKKILLLFAVLILTACEGQVLDDLNTPIADPEDVRKEITLFEPVPLLAARFEATEDGYEVFLYRTLGSPTSTIIQNWDVNIDALDVEGQVLSSVSVVNPRDIHTVGARNPDTAVLPSATFTVFFAEPLEIRSLQVSVVNGANSGLKETYEVEPRRLKQIDEGDL